jgi:hypothetical protein
MLPGPRFQVFGQPLRVFGSLRGWFFHCNERLGNSLSDFGYLGGLGLTKGVNTLTLGTKS